MIGSLTMLTNHLCYLASRDEVISSRVIKKMANYAKNLEVRATIELTGLPYEENPNPRAEINDPKIVNTKKAPP